ncbi:MAG: proline--tRNA ligase [Deltaproteobacteria bacterium]|nr:proline--tRNA ligase [Deltaproteobacteria bacterium]
MRYSNYYIPTLKEDPAEAEVISHKLLLRAGMIRKLTAGVYTYLPLGLRALNKVSAIVREEMNRAGSLEILMPTVQPADLWKESGRWNAYGRELLRFLDRHDRESCLGPTHEEVVTDLIRGEVRSYRQLPLNLYQIQTKFRDEIRPRFGLMRGREFVMKDAYSFDRDEEGAERSYWAMYEAYKLVFGRLGLRFRAVEADSGSIGGSFSHEFMVLADTGEDTLVVCESCQYAANLEKARVKLDEGAVFGPCPSLTEVATPGKHTVSEVADFFGLGPERIIKTLLYDVDGSAVAVLIRGDRELNEIKLKNRLGAEACSLATPDQVREWSGAPVGFAGPVGLASCRILADQELAQGTDWVVGANKADFHLVHVSLERDVLMAEYADLRNVTETDSCPECSGKVSLPKGIEVGHVFKLGTKYSRAMNAVFLDEQGRERIMIMGCYGIGVSRVVAACIEQNHDEKGMIFPPPIAPFEAVLIPLAARSQEVTAKAEKIYGQLQAMGVEVLLDDRDERPGIKFNDADLVGCPMQLVLGEKGLVKGILEAKDRRTGEKTELRLDAFEADFNDWRRSVHRGWNLAAS